jgi:hypothetical protein
MSFVRNFCSSITPGSADVTETSTEHKFRSTGLASFQMTANTRGNLLRAWRSQRWSPELGLHAISRVSHSLFPPSLTFGSARATPKGKGIVSYCAFNNLPEILGLPRSPTPGKNYALPGRFGDKIRKSPTHQQAEESGPARHADDLRVFGSSIPELKQDDIATVKFQILWTLGSVVEHVFVEQEMETLKRDAKQVGCFLLGEKFVFCGANHGIYLVGGLYLFGESWRIR